MSQFLLIILQVALSNEKQKAVIRKTISLFLIERMPFKNRKVQVFTCNMWFIFQKLEQVIFIFYFLIYFASEVSEKAFTALKSWCTDCCAVRILFPSFTKKRLLNTDRALRTDVDFITMANCILHVYSHSMRTLNSASYLLAHQDGRDLWKKWAKKKQRD